MAIRKVEFISHDEYFSLEEFCDICDVHTEYIIEMVQFGILEPKGKSKKSWKFCTKQLQRSKQAIRLQHDLDLNLSGVALALELLDEIEELRQHLSLLEQRLRIED